MERNSSAHADEHATWRSALIGHAERIRADGAGAATSGLREQLDSVFGPDAGDAIALVEAYARGEKRHEVGREDFRRRIKVILNGLSGMVLAVAPPVVTGARPSHVIQSDLWQLLRMMRESAELSYAREQDLIELDRRILFLLQNAGPLVPAEISGAVGVDKAQVSRSVKRLLELGLVDRGQIRAPLKLTRGGEALARRMLRMAELRNRELTFDITDEELAAFLATLDNLLDQAIELYEHERLLAQAAGRPADLPGPGKGAERKAAEAIVMDRSRIISPMMTLSAYFSRSGALACKRLTGLSTFEAYVLSEIGIAPPVDWGTLVSALNRDQSQAGRTVKALMDRGLVEREGKPGRRHGRFFPSAEGLEVFKVIHEEGRRRSTFLMERLTEDHKVAFLHVFRKIRHNAEAQLQREKTFAELDRDEE